MTIELVNNVTYSFYAVAVITTIAFTYSLHLIFNISPPQMSTYKYYLLNIQVAAYVETIYYTVLLSVIWMTPHFGVNAEGLLCKVFKMPTKYPFGIYTGFYCCVTCALNAAYIYRYRLLLFVANVKISNRLLAIIIVSTYVLSVGMSVPFATMAFQEHDESVAEVRKTTAITMTLCIPVLMLSVSFSLGPTLVTSTDAYVWIGSVMFSMKAFNGTVAMIIMTKAYREHFMKITGLSRLWPKIEPIPVAPTITTTPILD
ncbi:unnamed protein product [Haemonchus placei]|uniref:G protein-coupled receptor n=1 Tax=Haemonchus placei TaxID=6290 RepID=A0A0N4WZT5_HAEPC|nr:unnamed protein product [Haemonchus placei]